MNIKELIEKLTTLPQDAPVINDGAGFMFDGTSLILEHKSYYETVHKVDLLKAGESALIREEYEKWRTDRVASESMKETFKKNAEKYSKRQSAMPKDRVAMPSMEEQQAYHKSNPYVTAKGFRDQLQTIIDALNEAKEKKVEPTSEPTE
jgi:Asp-tRNA(Asn)/Glu-tRNA(Gln) amidotransferase C subunit